ncbi:MAG TPA: copper resistance CopC family protein [Chloroflexota bacterium]|jgi:methionine-rich copper-binding protein CopC|nr:copper resistance CopC family protein [Chloroflexota bacterium]
MYLVRRLACAGLIALTLGLVPRLAAAHANPTRSEPGMETVTPTAPTELKVWFSEELASQGNSLEVLDSSGARVDRGDARVDLNDPDRKLLVVSLNPLPDGVYTVNWRSVSRDDGHEASGSFRFGVGANTVLPPRETGATPRIAVASATLDGNTLRVQMDVQGVTIRRPPASAGHMDDDDHGAHAHDAAMSGGPYGHFHVYLDGQDVLHAYEPTFTLSSLPAGAHQLRIALMTEQHSEWSPPVETTLTVLVP